MSTTIKRAQFPGYREHELSVRVAELVEQVASAYRYAYSICVYHCYEKSTVEAKSRIAVVRTRLRHVDSESTPFGPYVRIEAKEVESNVDVYEASVESGLAVYVFKVPDLNIEARFPPVEFPDVAFLVTNPALLELAVQQEVEQKNSSPWLKYPVPRTTVEVEVGLATVKALGTVVYSHPFSHAVEYKFVETPDGIVATDGDLGIILDTLVPRSELETISAYLRDLVVEVRRGLSILGRALVR